jgi:hypothetical protein
MGKKDAKGKQSTTLPKSPMDLDQLSFNLDKQDQFVTAYGPCFVHYRAMPSPIGLKDRGEYRRSDALDTLSENGFIYTKCGEFNATILGNSKSKKAGDGGLIDISEGRLTLPRFYNEDSDEEAGERIHLCPGDRIFLKNVDKKEKDVVNYQRVNYNPNGDDYLQFPVTCVESLMDSQGVMYKEGVHFRITRGKVNAGNIRWIDGKKNPGIDTDTGKGRVYSVRYRYEAHWYIAQIVNELRISQTTENGIRKESRLPYQAVIQREYVYHQRVRGDSQNSDKDNETNRTVPAPDQPIDPNKFKVKVDVKNFE